MSERRRTPQVAKRDPHLTEATHLVSVRWWFAIADIRDEQRTALPKRGERGAFECIAVAGLGERRTHDRDRVEFARTQHLAHISTSNVRRIRMTFAALPRRERPRARRTVTDARDLRTELVSAARAASFPDRADAGSLTL